MIITVESRSNEKIKAARKLASAGKYRRETGEFFLEGLRLCSDALESGVAIERLFFTEAAKEKHPHKVNRLIEGARQAYAISSDVEKFLAETQSSQGIFAVCRMGEPSLEELKPSGKYIALECVQDPANLGAVIRTAEALGIDGAILSGCCDIYNPKALRAAMGSLLRLPLMVTEDLSALILKSREAGFSVLATTPDENAERITQRDLSGGVISIIGNEGNGVSPEIMSLCEKVTIPMRGRAESLNASMAAAIVMWEMMRQR